MPRMQPPPGYITAKEAQERLNVSDTLLRRYVQRGQLKRYGPMDRTYRPWYKEEEVEALYHAQQMLEEVTGKSPATSFEIAKEEDMSAILDIDTRIFGHPAASLAVQLSWMRRNPHTFYVLRDEQGVIRAYASLVPMSEVVIGQFVRDELKGEDITPDMIEEYIPGKPLDVYIMAIMVAPDCSKTEKKTYGGHIILGLFKSLLELAGQGVDIRTITARNFMRKGELELPDGLHLLKRIGLTQIKSPVQGINLFVVNVPESGIPIFEKYSRILETWKAEHEGTRT